MIIRAAASAPQTYENWALALSWSLDQRNVAGLAIGCHEQDYTWLHTHFERLGQNESVLYIPLLFIEAVLVRTSLELRKHGQRLFRIESRTRLLLWSDARVTLDSSHVSYDVLTKALVGLGCRLALHELQLEGLKTTLQKVGDCAQKMRSHEQLDLAKLQEERKRLCEVTQSLSQILTHHQRVAQNLFEAVSYFLTPLSMLNLIVIQHDVLVSLRYNQISQTMSKEQRTMAQSSLQIAETAKVDSSSMKALVHVGTAFLPATFISVRPLCHTGEGPAANSARLCFRWACLIGMLRDPTLS